MTSILSNLAKQFNVGQRSIKPEVLLVEVSTSQLVDSYAEQLYVNYSRYTPGHLGNAIPSVDEFVFACRLLVKARTIYVNGGKLPERPNSRAWVVPHGLNAILELVGKVYVKEQDLHIKPVVKNDVELTADEFKQYRKVALFMQSVDGVMPVAYTLPRSEEGNVEFMMFQHLDNLVASPLPNAEPGLALAAAFIRMETAASIFNPRFTYGLVEDYQYAIEALACPTSGVAQ